MATELKGLTAVVTGGGAGIGQAMCRNWADAGMNVVVADLEGTRAEETAKAIEAAGGRAVAVACDVGDAKAVEALADRAYEAFGAVNVVCNNAGVVQFGPVAIAPQDDWEWLFKPNLWGVVNVIRTFTPRLKAQGSGLRHMVNTASLSGIFAVPGLGVYTASKYAVVGISETLRDELKKDGIGVSVLCPGPTPSRIGENARTTTEPGKGAFEDAGQFNFLESRTVEQVAACVRAGVLANRLYIFSHKPGRIAAERRFNEILADFDAAP
ncbi:SDR family NAD(P)-dependent oxidoreductase [uncultured Phenylobacterium sp.]|uniref:SDR family NAD(P)-dependent oxidoreductase n=1 Tax=uncultured Phenylobacterium sp. TaxID=349273 RepID=UPI0025FB0F63|nr:SDR family NAD(P)-dependent oxidoreductase [uncultured Phenylobacterium sp.]